MVSRERSELKINFELGKMGEERSGLQNKRVKIHGEVLLGFIIMLICTIQFSVADTDPVDGNNDSVPF